ncbi:class I SAM-dependent methyltransferase [Rugosimonospora africana]|uniref:SAM-dependent methyltransferase n=1 Tax=Rugosimonospora africana TaxID=556532 RepID=A0A8J3VTN7_9ACTN|nr:class I SAM-dependent methyltransferase [Rugosimonospora africana]GIH18627.1 SAM-dependent methyltransferase [Rugosimonospora africana]
MVSVSGEIAANQANWDERVPSHLVAYGVDEFIADPGRISATVRDDLPLLSPHLPGRSPAGLTLLHLQCHIGLDTLSWARLGAAVTGLDFSAASIAAARNVADRAGLPARFIHSEIDHAASACRDRFDVIYTGIGALCWLPDLTRWARVIAELLAPGGVFYVRDSHPMLNSVDDERDDDVLVVSRPYFAGRPLRYDEGTTYADGSVRLTNATTYEWQHSLSEIVQSLLDAGLALTSLTEHRTIPWRALPVLVRSEHGWVLPEGSDRLPLTFSLTATKSVG